MINYEIKAENAAQKDLDEKLKLEEPFKRELAVLFALIANDFRITVARTGMTQDVNAYIPAFTQLLKKQYARVQKRFVGNVSGFIGVTLTRSIKEELEFQLLEWSKNIAPQQAEIITETTGKNMQDSLNKGITENLDDGMGFSNRAAAATGAALLRKKFKGRVGTIATYETQNSSENTKSIEVDVLESSRVIERTVKTWQTVGDRIVRLTHNKANKQKILKTHPFAVGGSFLMQPGDSSLGAAAKEFMECRCAATYSADILQTGAR